MSQNHITRIAQELTLSAPLVGATIALLDEDATVPFIARYRKEMTGSLDEVAIMQIRDRVRQLRELDERRAAILKSLEERQLLTDELKTAVDAAETMAALEDIYLPYRPKRRTRATVAREKGLEPLAACLFEQGDIDPAAEAAAYIDEEKGVTSVEDALTGARDIIAEWVNEDQAARAAIRDLFERKATMRARAIEGKQTDGAKFSAYFDWEEPIATAPSHRILAMRRGENEGVLSLAITPPEPEAIALLERRFIKGTGAASEHVAQAVEDGYRRLLSLSMETELRTATKQKADTEAIRVFVENLRELLLAPPLGTRTVLAIDPGFRTGCKIACLDRQGKLVHADTIFPHSGEHQHKKATETLKELCARYHIEAVAIGNGTAGRETEGFVRSIALPGEPQVVVVNESGASVYSASEVARREFPDQDLTVRGSVSIGRRLMDPLAELVKIDPKSIGVGQYQHDVDQGELKKSLDDAVMSCVNRVGVELNTASAELLSYVSGVGPVIAKNIVSHRDANGPFDTRQGLLDVPRLGPKAFQQAAGFLRIRDAKNPLDASAVHPERYAVVDQMAHDLGCSIQALINDADMRARVRLERYVGEHIGLPTLTDIVQELARPGRDPREQFDAVQFTEGVYKIEQVKPGMKMTGVITNVTNFGAFVDIGVHHDGLVHVSQLADRYVKQAADVVKVGQKVDVTVMEVDLTRQRISLTMRAQPPADAQADSDTRQAVKTETPAPIDLSRRRPPRQSQHVAGAARPERNRDAAKAPSPKGTVVDLLKLNKGRL